MNKKGIGIILVLVVLIIIIISIITLNGKTKVEDKNIDGNLEDIMQKLYSNIPEEEMPSALVNTVVTDENVEYYLGTSDIDYVEAVASEPSMSSIAHSVVLLRVENSAQAQKVKQKIKENVNPRKWVCVWVEDENVKVESRGNLVVLIMNDTLSDKILENFNNL